MDPCSVSKPHGKNEREGDTGARGHSNHGLHLPDKRQHKRRKRPRSKACWQCGHLGVGRDGLMAKAENKHALWTSKRQQGVETTDRTSSLAQRTHQSKLKGPPYQRQSHEKIDLSRLGERGLFMVCEEGSHVTRPRSRKSPKRGGIPPNLPSFWGGSREPGT